MVFIKVLAIILVLIGIYIFIDDQLDISLNSEKMDEKDDNKKGNYLESIAGASFDDQLIEVLLMISSCLKAGRNLDQAFELVAVSTPPPICNEFKKLCQERRLGVSMVEALSNLANRVPSQDLRLAVNATIFQQETGGNLEALYSQILTTITERKKIMGKIVAGTAHARLSGNLVATIPVFLSIILLYMQPDYLKPMITNPYGQVALLIAVTATILGVIFINRITTSILPDAEEAMISKNDYSTNKRNFFYKLLHLIIKPFAVIISLLPPNLTNKAKNETKFLLNASGKTEEYDVDEFLGLRALSMVVFAAIMAIFVNPMVMGLSGWIVLLFLLPIGFKLPRIYLAHIIKKRQKNIEFELPYVIDLLSLAIESGLDLIGGITKVVEKSRNTDIIVEFKMFLADVKVGKSMEECLSEMAERVKVLSFFSFVSSLIQAQRLGADIGPTLRAQAEQMRYQRLILAEERVNKLPVKLLIPLVFFVFPSISVLLIGPAMIQIQTKFPKPEQVTSEEVKGNEEIAVKGEMTENAQPGQIVQPNESVQPSKSLLQEKEQKTSGNSKNNGNYSSKAYQKTEVRKDEVKKTVKPHQTLKNEQLNRREHSSVENMPVVPNVTPAPIIISEPVIPASQLRTPSNKAPVRVEEPVQQRTIQKDRALSPRREDASSLEDNTIPLYKERVVPNSNSSSNNNKGNNTDLVPIEVYIGE